MSNPFVSFTEGDIYNFLFYVKIFLTFFGLSINTDLSRVVMIKRIRASPDQENVRIVNLYSLRKWVRDVTKDLGAYNPTVSDTCPPADVTTGQVSVGRSH